MTTIVRGPRLGRSGLVLVVAAALLIALCGAVTAAGLITGKQIKDGSVTGRDLRDGSATGVDVRDGSLGPSDYAGAVVGPPGVEGPAGDAGPPGAPGEAGVLGPWRVVVGANDVAPGAWRRADARCPFTDLEVLSGGVEFLSPNARGTITESAPLNDAVGWTGAFRNDGPSNLTGYIWAVCARV